tara:strand:- start:732 stop:908 length:177 start_codon:yes stop_codon:yes gene_type:complete
MYQEKFIRGISMVDSLTAYRKREKIVHDVKNGVISPAEGGFLSGYHEASIYSEEEEEE